MPPMLACVLPSHRLIALRILASRRLQQRSSSSGSIASMQPASAAASAATAPPPPQGARPKVLILTGPTAVGKTKASLALAEALGGEIISADSVQVYHGLDVGSDKIPLDERRGIPHHLLDVLDPHQDFSAGDFFVLARAAAEDILRRGKTPIVVGGTGLYLRWFIHGRPTTPRSSPASEAVASQRLEQAYAEASAALGGRELTTEERWGAAVGLVAALGDAASALRLAGEPNNQYRLVRVVDILLQSGGVPLADQNLDAQRPSDYDCRCFFLHRPRLQLYHRIDARVEEMVAGGLLKEAQMLLEAGCPSNSHCASRAIGYRQALGFLEAQRAAAVAAAAASTAAAAAAANIDAGAAAAVRTADGPTPQAVIQLVKDVQAASRHLCHKQMTWFRDEEMFRWVDATAGEEAVHAEILERWNRPQHEGGCGNSGRLTKEEEVELKRYITKQRLYFNGSEVLQHTQEEARLVLQQLQQAGDGSGGGGADDVGAGAAVTGELEQQSPTEKQEQQPLRQPAVS